MWIANLSDGTIVTEEDLKVEPGGLSPWRQMIEKCASGEARITGMRLGVGPALINAISLRQCDGYYHAYEHFQSINNLQIQHTRQGIGSVVGEQVFITWMEVGDNGLTYIWQEMRPLKDCLEHTILS